MNHLKQEVIQALSEYIGKDPDNFTQDTLNDITDICNAIIVRWQREGTHVTHKMSIVDGIEIYRNLHDQESIEIMIKLRKY